MVEMRALFVHMRLIRMVRFPKAEMYVHVAAVFAVALFVVVDSIATQHTPFREALRIEHECLGVLSVEPQLDCTSNRLATLALSRGLGTAFKTLSVLYSREEWLPPVCGAVASKVGSEFYAKNTHHEPIRFEAESVFCNYGFFQSYARTLVLDTKNPELGRDFCESVGEQLDGIARSAVNECYRGIGTALPFVAGEDVASLHEAVAFSIQSCEKIAEKGEKLDSCVEGAFNKRGRAEAAKDSFGDGDPLEICREYPSYRRLCIGNFKWAIVLPFLSEPDTQKSLATIAQRYAGSDFLQELLMVAANAFGYTEAARSPGSPDFNGLLRTCKRIGDKTLMEQCMQGVATGLSKSGVPGLQYKDVLRFCSASENGTGGLVECPGPVALAYMKGFYPPQKYSEICKAFNNQHPGSCLEE